MVNEVSEGRCQMLVLSGQSRVQLAPGWGAHLPALTCRNDHGASQVGTGGTEGTGEAEMGPESGGGRDRAVEAEPLQLLGCECCRLSLWV